MAILPSMLFAENPEHRKLAEHYAPVVFQESRSAVLDFITRFDFDGDWNGANNWRNAYLHELNGYVYYAVIESTNHWFITYAFYHPRDYTARPYEGFAPKTEHENDMEGCTFAIEKDGTPFGKPILLETLAHDVFFKYNNPHYPRVKPGATKLDGSIVFLKEEDATHHREPAIYIEPEGHGVKGAGPEVRDPAYKFPGIVYRYGPAAVPENNQDPRATYDLIPIEDTLWLRRLDVGTTYCCSDPYAATGGQTMTIGSAFNGPIGSCAAKPPWGWDQANDPIVKGDWFRDPLKAYAAQLQVEGLSGEYVYNPYLGTDGRNAGSPCATSATSKTVRGALTSSILGIGRALTAGGLSKGQIGDQAKQLFLTDTVLLEWARKGDFEKWSWDKSLTALPALVSDGLRDEMRIPLLSNFSFASPTFKAPARYFDSVILRYKAVADGLSAKVYWTYEGMTDFTEEFSQSVPLPKTEVWKITQIALTSHPKFDRGKTLVKIRIDIVSPAGATTVDPQAPGTRTSQVTLNYIVFDRNAFSDTFER